MNDGYITRCDAFVVLTEYYHHTHEIQGKALQEALSRVPAADVRPVVLCADCQYTKSDGCGAIYCEKWDMWEMPPDGFCYKGKRRNGNE